MLLYQFLESLQTSARRNVFFCVRIHWQFIPSMEKGYSALTFFKISPSFSWSLSHDSAEVTKSLLICAKQRCCSSASVLQKLFPKFLLFLITKPGMTCMTYTIVVFAVKNSWWWTEELSETCRVFSKNKFEKLAHLVGFIIRIYHDPPVTWTSSSCFLYFLKVSLSTERAWHFCVNSYLSQLRVGSNPRPCLFAAVSGGMSKMVVIRNTVK